MALQEGQFAIGMGSGRTGVNVKGKGKGKGNAEDLMVTQSYRASRLYFHPTVIYRALSLVAPSGWFLVLHLPHLLQAHKREADEMHRKSQ